MRSTLGVAARGATCNVGVPRLAAGAVGASARDAGAQQPRGPRRSRHAGLAAGAPSPGSPV